MKKLVFAGALAAFLAACGSGESGTAPYAAMQAQDGAAMRFAARDVVGMLNPVCPYSEQADQQARYDAPRGRYEAVKEWVDGKPLAIDLASVEADYQYYWTVNQAECGDPDTPENMERLDNDLNVLDQRLTQMEELAGMM